MQRKTKTEAVTAEKGLEMYRKALWRKAVLEGTEEFTKAAKIYNDFLKPMDEAVNSLRHRKKSSSECMYWVIYFTFLSFKRPLGVPEIMDEIAAIHRPMHRSTYFRTRERALKLLDEILTKEALTA